MNLLLTSVYVMLYKIFPCGLLTLPLSAMSVITSAPIAMPHDIMTHQLTLAEKQQILTVLQKEEKLQMVEEERER